MNVADVRRRYTELLLERIDETRFPSGDLMNRVESVLASPEHAERYVQILIDRVEQTRYPSGQLLDRLERALGRLAAVDAARGRDGRM